MPHEMVIKSPHCECKADTVRRLELQHATCHTGGLYGGSGLVSTTNSGGEVPELEPEDYTVPVTMKRRIAERGVVMRDRALEM